jgi:hypothetical protein
VGIRVSIKGRLLLERIGSERPLEAEVEWPTALTERSTLRWQATEETCLAVLGCSNDDGLHWSPLSIPTAGHTIEFDTATLAGGNVLLELRVTDGTRTISLRSHPYDVPRKGWMIWILSPADKAVVSSESPVLLAAQAFHLEERQSDAESIRWSSSLDGDLGSGALLSAQLSPGAHKLAAAVNGASAEVDVLIER